MTNDYRPIITDLLWTKLEEIAKRDPNYFNLESAQIIKTLIESLITLECRGFSEPQGFIG